MKLILICSFFLLLGIIWGWGLAKMGKGEMPSVYEYPDDMYDIGADPAIEWEKDKSVFNMAINDNGDIITVNSHKERMV